MKRCTKTMSGKHIWELVGIGGSKTRMEHDVIYVCSPDTHKKCLACGLIDDRPKRKGKHEDSR